MNDLFTSILWCFMVDLTIDLTIKKQEVFWGFFTECLRHNSYVSLW